MGKNLQYVKFTQINLSDHFFDSLREDYVGFEDWFHKKAEEFAYVHYDKESNLDGFLYVKLDGTYINDVEPVIKSEKIVKIGTFKINPHGTRLGERFIKSALDYAIEEKASVCYVTIFEKHSALISLLQKYGFQKYGVKKSSNGEELVLLKELTNTTGNVITDYPLINTNSKRKFLLSIYPNYHTVMFPDSMLNNESSTMLKDVPYTNSIHKIYICRMEGVDSLQNGDIIIVYRTAEAGKNAEYSSVVTSVCIVETVKSQNEFKDFEDFYRYACTYSVFDKDDLSKWYKKGNCIAINMTYNCAFKKRITRHELIESLGLPRSNYWGFMKVTDEQFSQILKVGEVNESIIIN
ncbi:hypothetical protein SAMN02746066_04091 [Anaerosporobacter mobilis DSM 15930]|jgi:hypothetical protein|uniref:Uncharacterized protein n=1 Tax=Anaerosporobacter mobilis DSM 15930 TaxID=1120996 RepID=A0A1M7MX43_9FIRM|nr:N-acetyltransferase [Anaerosporobacter mobilis]SHM95742.1 hypothetical protein SAMN02746066_04091 [Anaerosporobacter mobilis DSM 15930]